MDGSIGMNGADAVEGHGGDKFSPSVQPMVSDDRNRGTTCISTAVSQDSHQNDEVQRAQSLREQACQNFVTKTLSSDHYLEI